MIWTNKNDTKWLSNKRYLHVEFSIRIAHSLFYMYNYLVVRIVRVLKINDSSQSFTFVNAAEDVKRDTLFQGYKFLLNAIF